MKAKIQTLPQAIAIMAEVKQTVEDLGEFLKSMNSVFDQFSMIKGEPVASSSAHAPESWPATPQNKSSSNGNGSVMSSKPLSDKVIYLLAESGKELKTKEIVACYKSHGWPFQNDKKLYEAIGATVSYLYKRKNVLSRGSNGYSLKRKFPE